MFLIWLIKDISKASYEWCLEDGLFLTFPLWPLFGFLLIVYAWLVMPYNILKFILRIMKRTFKWMIKKKLQFDEEKSKAPLEF